MPDMTSLLSTFLQQLYSGTVGVSKVALGDGTAGAPAINFTSEPTLGFYRISAAVMGLAGSLQVSGGLTSAANQQLGANALIYWSSRTQISSSGNGLVTVANFAASAGVGFDVLTDTLLKIRTRAQTGYGALAAGASGIAATSTDGITAENDTAATVGVPVQQSPRLRFRSQVWNTTTPANNTADFWVESLPISGATPSVRMYFYSSMNGGAAVQAANLSSAGAWTVIGNLIAGVAAVVGWNGRTSMTSPADGQANVTTTSGTTGVGLDVATDAVLKIRTRAQSAYAQVDALGYSVGGVAGASKAAGAVTSITVVNGIVTAIS